MLSPQKYLLYMFVPAIIVASFLSVGYLSLLRTGELLSPDAIAERQWEKDSKYGAAIQALAFQHKLSLYRKIKPKIVTMGSSRAMQFQANSFSKSFINVGGATSGPIEGLALAKGMLPHHKPDIIILTVDYWWLNDNYNEPAAQMHHDRYLDEVPILLDILIKPWVWLIERKVTPKQFLFLLSQEHDSVGASAILREDGVDKYGTHYYTSMTRGVRKHEDYEFNKTQRSIEQNKKIYVPSDTISETRRDQLLEFFEYITSQGITLITVLPPMSDYAVKTMTEDGGYTYIPKLRDWLKTTGLEHYDYHDASSLGSDDCEFVDGNHGGAILYMRMLNDMSQKSQTQLSDYLDLDFIQKTIVEKKGYATYPTEGEIDFLNIGCPRNQNDK